MQIQSPIKAATYDVYFEVKDEKGGFRKIVAGLGVDQDHAQRLIGHPERPRGSRFVCRPNR